MFGWASVTLQEPSRLLAVLAVPSHNDSSKVSAVFAEAVRTLRRLTLRAGLRLSNR